MQVDLLISFILDYFSFYPTLAGILLVQASQLPATSLLYGKEITTQLTVSILSGCVWQAVNLFGTHIIMTKVGMIFVESEVVRIGND